jgi:hypothetical protein
LSNSVRPFDYVVKAGQAARQKVFPGDTLREKSVNRVSIPRRPVRLVTGAALRTGAWQPATFQAQRGPSSYIKGAALIRCPHNTQYLLHKENTMRFMMIMFPSYANAKPGTVPDFKDMEVMASTTRNYRKPACCSRSTG